MSGVTDPAPESLRGRGRFAVTRGTATLLFAVAIMAWTSRRAVSLGRWDARLLILGIAVPILLAGVTVAFDVAGAPGRGDWPPSARLAIRGALLALMAVAGILAIATGRHLACLGDFTCR